MNRKSDKNRKKKKKRSPFARMMRTIAVVALLCALAALGGFAALLARLQRVNVDRSAYAQQQTEIEMLRAPGVENILIVGLDEWQQEGSRSDTMLVVTIDSNNSQLKLTSLARDIYLTIPEYGDNRLNAAWAYGGYSLLIATIEQNFGLPIDSFVCLDFMSFDVLIEALGGYDMELTQPEFEVLEEALIEAGIDTSSGAGTYHLIKRSALDFVRMRKIDSDLVRGGRQRRAIVSMMAELRQRSAAEIMRILWLVAPYVTTDMSTGAMMRFIGNARAYLDWPVYELGVPVDGTWRDAFIDGMSVLSLDWRANREILHDFILNPGEQAQ